MTRRSVTCAAPRRFDLAARRSVPAAAFAIALTLTVIIAPATVRAELATVTRGDDGARSPWPRSLRYWRESGGRIEAGWLLTEADELAAAITLGSAPESELLAIRSAPDGWLVDLVIVGTAAYRRALRVAAPHRLTAALENAITSRTRTGGDAASADDAPQRVVGAGGAVDQRHQQAAPDSRPTPTGPAQGIASGGNGFVRLVGGTPLVWQRAGNHLVLVTAPLPGGTP